MVVVVLMVVDGLVDWWWCSAPTPGEQEKKSRCELIPPPLLGAVSLLVLAPATITHCRLMSGQWLSALACAYTRWR